MKLPTDLTTIVIACAAVVGVILGAVGLTDEGAEAGQISAFVAHCDDALDAARAQHANLRVEAAAAPDDESLQERVAEDAERDVCGVKVSQAVERPGRSFATYLDSR